jgi:hypothetical protein
MIKYFIIQNIVSTLGWLYHTYMVRHSNKWIAEILTTSISSSAGISAIL